jgi:hypothetical protein
MSMTETDEQRRLSGVEREDFTFPDLQSRYLPFSMNLRQLRSDLPCRADIPSMNVILSCT